LHLARRRQNSLQNSQRSLPHKSNLLNLLNLPNQLNQPSLLNHLVNNSNSNSNSNLHNLQLARKSKFDGG
jgi:hypothetical protein